MDSRVALSADDLALRSSFSLERMVRGGVRLQPLGNLEKATPFSDCRVGRIHQGRCLKYKGRRNFLRHLFSSKTAILYRYKNNERLACTLIYLPRKGDRMRYLYLFALLICATLIGCNEPVEKQVCLPESLLQSVEVRLSPKDKVVESSKSETLAQR